MKIRELYEKAGGDLDELLSRIPVEAMISKFIKKYVSSNEFENLTEAYKSKDYQSVFEISHNLKGMSANLSLTAINKTVSEICEAVRGGEPTTDLEPLMEQATKDHELLLALVEQLED